MTITKSKNERYSIIPPLGSKFRTQFAKTEEEALEIARNVAAESPEGKTEVVFRTDSSYIDIGHFDYYGKFTHAEKS